MLAPWLVCIGDSEEVIINLGLKHLDRFLLLTVWPISVRPGHLRNLGVLMKFVNSLVKVFFKCWKL